MAGLGLLTVLTAAGWSRPLPQALLKKESDFQEQVLGELEKVCRLSSSLGLVLRNWIELGN